MKNIFEIMAEAGVEIPADKKDAINAAVADNYKTIAEHTKVKDKLTATTDELKAANGKITSMGETIKGYEGSDDTIKDLQAQVDKYKQEEADRAAAARAKQADEQLTTIVEAAIGDVEFVNDYTKTSIIDAVKKGVQENAGKGAKEIFDEITKDQEGIFKNPQQVKTMPPGGSTQHGASGSNKEYMQNKYKDNPFYKG